MIGVDPAGALIRRYLDEHGGPRHSFSVESRSRTLVPTFVGEGLRLRPGPVPRGGDRDQGEFSACQE
ncbi:hypothetical protein C5C04_12115 [Rathayibacter rathayi]|uniref:Uncharacterized protein n=1 Tax=Rathayibacter rathayi TaxID=33887 RepID=A0ABD6W665_RATRA|nr:hypothetical protein C5C04_12115 [Rathayibacter rathayi]